MEVEIKKHIQTEKQRDTWRKIGAVNKKNQWTKVVKVWVKETHANAQGHQVVKCRECVTKPVMEDAVIKENEIIQSSKECAVY